MSFDSMCASWIQATVSVINLSTTSMDDEGALKILINNQFLYFGSGCLMWIGTAFDTDITSGASMGYRLLKEGQIIPH